MMHSIISAMHTCFYDFSIITDKNQGNSEIIADIAAVLPSSANSAEQIISVHSVPYTDSRK